MVPIVAIGCIAGMGGSFFSIYPLNVVGRAFKRFRPAALAIVNLGAPVGSFIMPYAANGLLSRSVKNILYFEFQMDIVGEAIS